MRPEPAGVPGAAGGDGPAFGDERDEPVSGEERVCGDGPADRWAGADALPYRVVATDLDGTLLRTDLTFSLRTRQALKLATGAGALHLVVTGRPASSCRPFLLDLGYDGLAVCGQGAQLYDATTDRLLMTASLGRGPARDLVAAVERELGPLELGVVTAAPENRCVSTAGFFTPPPPGSETVTDRALLWAEPIEKVLMRHRELPDRAVAETAGRLAGDAMTVVHSQAGMVELLPAGTTKAAGLAAAAELLGFTAADTIAFGDMPNDLPMLDWAGYGVAMAGGHPELLAAADETAPGNDADGVAVVLERLFGAACGDGPRTGPAMLPGPRGAAPRGAAGHRPGGSPAPAARG
ncbi:HAD family hydrolase [Streptomyces xinghaiensis]|uniref:HAD family hydrolase n=1 Tax=Streptomyces xinghaiensis TaxID=1038928 RepID=UPI002E13BBE7|nr:Cof-type HAD-IIB family hydrolase [Streptomyces xinghaiensis]